MNNPIEILNEIERLCKSDTNLWTIDSGHIQSLRAALEDQANWIKFQDQKHTECAANLVKAHEELAQKDARIARVEGAVQSSVNYLASQVPGKLNGPPDESANQSATAFDVGITNDKHNWKCISAGEYDTMYECQRCDETHLESIDNPESEPPITGCKGE